ncbi:hypothetical protein AAFF_G00438870, partial [Aldrovandia affinis]
MYLSSPAYHIVKTTKALFIEVKVDLKLSFSPFAFSFPAFSFQGFHCHGVSPWCFLSALRFGLVFLLALFVSLFEVCVFEFVSFWFLPGISLPRIISGSKRFIKGTGFGCVISTFLT